MPQKKLTVLVSLAIFNFLTVLAFWASAIIFFGDWLNLPVAAAFLSSFTLLLTSLSLTALLSESRRQALEMLLPAAVIGVPLFPLSPFTPLQPLIILTAGFIFAHHIRQDKSLYVKLVPTRLLQPHLGLLFLAFSLLVSLAHYETTREVSTRLTLEIPDEIFTQAAALALKYAETALPQSPLSLPPGQNPLDQFKVQIDQMIQPLREESNRQLAVLVEPYRPFLPVVFSFSFFLSLTFFGTIVKNTALILSATIFTLFKKTGLVAVKKETREVETVTL